MGGTSVRGEPLPSWDEQSEKLQQAWKAAAVAVANAFYEEYLSGA